MTKRETKQMAKAQTDIRPFHALFTQPKGAMAHIQWKGTDVCMDFHCACGWHGHLDADFTYNLRCKKCGKVYAAEPFIRMIELQPQEVEKLIADKVTVHTPKDGAGEASGTHNHD